VSELLKHFGSVTRLRQATVEQITEVKGIGTALAQQIVDGLRNP
jgi:excinuclease ABC subunit C